MPQNETNSEAIAGDISIAELAAAMQSTGDISPEYLEIFGGTSDEEKKESGTDTAEVAAEVTEAVVEDSPEVQEETPEEVKEEVVEEAKDEESGLPLSVQKRIDKLTAEKYSAKEQVEALVAENNTLKAKLNTQTAVTPSPANPLADVNSAAELQQREAQFKSVRRFCMQNPDGGTVTGVDKEGKPTETYIPPEKIRELLIQSDDLITEAIPQRRSYLAQAEQFSVEAKNTYPALFTKGTEEGQLATQFLTMAPWVKNFPDWQLVLGDYIAGFKGRLARAKGNVTASGKKAVPAVKPLGAPKPASGGTRVAASKKSMHSVIGDRNGDLSVDDAADLLSSMF